MATTFIGGFYSPFQEPHLGGSPDMTAIVALGIKAVGDSQAHIFRAPRAGDIKKVGIIWSDTGVKTMRFSIQRLTAAGVPDNTPLVYRDAVNPTQAQGYYETGILSDDGTDLGNLLTVDAGDQLAFVADCTAYTSLSAHMYRRNSFLANYPLSAWRAGAGAWTLQEGGGLTIKYDGDIYRTPHRHSFQAENTPLSTALTSSSSPDEMGGLFVMPWDCNCDGAVILMRGSGRAQATLYDPDNVVLAQSTHEPGYGYSYSLGDGQYFRFYWDEVPLTAGLGYRFAIKALTATAVTIYSRTLSSVAVMAGDSGGLSGQRTHRAGGGAWTDSATEKVFAGLHVSAL